MAQVIGVSELRPKQGVSSAELEQFILTDMANAPRLPGTRTRFFRSDRGANDGGYAMFLEIESKEVRDKWWPRPGENSAELNQWWAENGAAWDRLFTIIDFTWNDYVELGG